MASRCLKGTECFEGGNAWAGHAMYFKKILTLQQEKSIAMAILIAHIYNIFRSDWRDGDRAMIQRYLKTINRTATSNGVQIHKSYLRALVGMDRRTLEDIGVSPQEVVMFSPSAVAWNSGVIASGRIR